MQITSIMNWRQPTEVEYPPFYATYVKKVPPGDFLYHFQRESERTQLLLEALDEAQWNHRYGPDKWSLKELLLHMMDTERIFTCRLLRIARGDQTPLPGFEQDDYVLTSEAATRSGSSILAEWKALRQSTLVFIRHLSPNMLERKGTASGGPVSALALAYMTLGHELHHRDIITDRYLG